MINAQSEESPNEVPAPEVNKQKDNTKKEKKSVVSSTILNTGDTYWGVVHAIIFYNNKSNNKYKYIICCAPIFCYFFC